MVNLVGKLVDERLQPLHVLAAAEIFPAQGRVDGLNDVTVFRSVLKSCGKSPIQQIWALAGRLSPSGGSGDLNRAASGSPEPQDLPARRFRPTPGILR